MAGTFGVTMAAMMLPSALPALVSDRRSVRAFAFGASFVAVWVAFDVVAFVAYDHSGLMAASWYVKGALIAAAAVYELTAVKRHFLRRCRANAYEGPAPARGARYAVDCVGCCAGLMLALFALDPMNMIWMIAVSALVFVQMLPVSRMWRSRWVGKRAADEDGSREIA